MKGKDKTGKKGDSYELLRDMFPLVVGDIFTYDYDTDRYLSRKNGLDGKPIVLESRHVLHQPLWFKFIVPPAIVISAEVIETGVSFELSTGRTIKIPHATIVNYKK